MHDNVQGFLEYSQNGLQPVHAAAQEGHEDVVKMLVEDFHIKPDAAGNVNQLSIFKLLVSKLLL